MFLNNKKIDTIKSLQLILLAVILSFSTINMSIYADEIEAEIENEKVISTIQTSENLEEIEEIENVQEEETEDIQELEEVENVQEEEIETLEDAQEIENTENTENVEIPENETTMLLFYDDEFHDYKAPAINIEINDSLLEISDVPPLIINDYTLVPLRDVFEGIGAEIDWNGDLQEIKIQYEDKLIKMNIDNENASVNEEVVELEQSPKIINDRTMIPVRFVGESIGFTVGWNAETHTVSLDDERPLGVFLPDGETDENIVNSDNVIDTSNDNLVQAEQTEELDEELNEESEGESQETTENTEENTYNAGQTAISSTEHLNYITIPSNASSISPCLDVSTSTIEEELHETTNINNLLLPELALDENGFPKNGTNIFIIESDKPITSVNKYLLEDNRLVLDVINSTTTLNSEYKIENNLAISEIRFGAYSENGVNSTKIAMDLSDGVAYAISLSFDRTKIYISFATNTIKNIEYLNVDGVDKLTITGVAQPSVDIGNLGNPNQIIVNLPYSQIENHVNTIVNGNYVDSIESMQINAIIARVVINLNRHGAYEFTSNGNTTTITIKEPSYKNIDFDKGNKTITLNKHDVDINTGNIIQDDDFMNRTYSFNLQKDLSYLFGNGEFMLRDENFHSISINTTNNSTTITVNENSVMTFKISEDDDNVYLQGFYPQELYDKIVVIDPGHGGTDPGAVYFGVTEAYLNLDMSFRLVELLKANGYVVYETRTTDIYPTLAERAEIANEIGDLFVSIHNNAASSAASGTEVWYYPHSNDDELGFSSKTFATITQANLINALASNNRGLKEGQLYVLNNTKIPAILCEVGFMSNSYEMSRLNDPSYRQLAAEAMYKSIVDAFMVYTPKR